ncbi:hypothetical protein BDZ85DRAFT_246800 [Elsinoe ampelina]|uniref:Uncharacterized protein n=1 Tax=Elsinoe ampelina TaxID=302913 RepID=A0A6A6GKQ8_9PEZI|nr:hypothetical protein BDZ85DRAFT_246800 [Elsinoe ampelina]
MSTCSPAMKISPRDSIPNPFCFLAFTGKLFSHDWNTEQLRWHFDWIIVTSDPDLPGPASGPVQLDKTAMKTRFPPVLHETMLYSNLHIKMARDGWISAGYFAFHEGVERFFFGTVRTHITTIADPGAMYMNGGLMHLPKVDFDQWWVADGDTVDKDAFLSQVYEQLVRKMRQG